jgi:DNA recombination protein RmuC
VVVAAVLIGLLAGFGLGYALFTRRNSRLAGDLKAAETRLEERDRQLEAVREELPERMEAISAKVLSQTSKEMAERLEQQRKAEDARARAEIKNVVNPVSQTLKQVQEQVKSLEEQRIKSQGEMGEQIKLLKEGVVKLASDASDLTAALKSPAGSGSWGELQLRNVIELAGMVEYCDFVTQETIQGDQGQQRPDVVVSMPGEKIVVIDAKAPMDAFLAAQAATDEDERRAQLARHAEKVKGHVTTLRTRNYQAQFDRTPDLVVMFVPSEGIYQAALSANPELLEFGLSENVLIATPTTLIALLKAIHYGWRQEQIARSAEDIARIGKDIHRRVITFSEHLRKVGKQLGSANKSFNEAIGSYEGMLVPKLREIEGAGAGSDKAIEQIPTVDTVTRELKEGEAWPADQDAELPEGASNGGASADELPEADSNGHVPEDDQDQLLT